MIICYLSINILYLIVLLKKGKKVENSDISSKISIKQLNILILIYCIEMCLLFMFNLNKGMPADELLYYTTAKSYCEMGHDLQGYSNAIYNVSWGFGTQSIGYLFIVIPLMKIFGYSILVFRLPMVIVWVVSIIVGIEYIKEKYSIERAFYALLYVVTSPLLIFSPLYVIDSHFLAPIVILGLVLLDKGIETKKNRYIYISMLYWGFSYYIYALTLPIITLFLIIVASYLIVMKKCKVRTIFLSVLICLSIAYCAIAGWLNILFSWTLPNIFEYPTADILRTADLAGMNIELVLTKILGEFFIGLTGVYEHWYTNYYYLSEYLPLYLKSTMIIILIGTFIVYRRTKQKQIGIVTIILSIVVVITNLMVIRGTDIRYDLLGICLAIYFSYIVVSTEGWQRRLIIFCNVCGFVVYLVIYNISLNIMQNSVNTNDLGTNKSLLKSIEYIYDNDIENVNVILSELTIKESDSMVNNYIYIFCNGIKSIDDRESVECLYNTPSILEVFKNYKFYVVAELGQLTETLDGYIVTKTKVGYNLIMNNLMTDELQDFVVLSNDVYTLVDVNKEYDLNLNYNTDYDNLNFLDNILRWSGNLKEEVYD